MSITCGYYNAVEADASLEMDCVQLLMKKIYQ
jgi:hypothetical protein